MDWLAKAMVEVDVSDGEGKVVNGFVEVVVQFDMRGRERERVEGPYNYSLGIHGCALAVIRNSINEMLELMLVGKSEKGRKEG